MDHISPEPPIPGNSLPTHRAFDPSKILGTYPVRPEDPDVRVLPGQADPNGVPQHAPGAKLDAGKVLAGLVVNGFSRAILAVAEVGTYGARKYTEDGWQHVDNGIKRYGNAKERHRLFGSFEERDVETGLLHAAHEAWNALAILELKLRAIEAEKNLIRS